MSITPVQLGQVAQVRPRDLIPPPPMSPWGSYVYDAKTARRVPAVARCLQLYAGLCKQMPIDAYRGDDLLDRPGLLSRPDPTPSHGRAWYVQVSVEDYLLDGNTVSIVTRRGADGWPLGVMWLPAAWVTIVMNDPYSESLVDYYYGGQRLPVDDVIHIRRGADRGFPARGIGIVEEHLSTLDRVALEEEYERATLAGASVPSVAVIAPQATLDQEQADEAKARWVTTYAGGREPAILPNGTQVIPLAWSPTDTQLVEARRMSLQDVANVFNIDGYWLGSPASGMTYRTAGPQYQQILRTSLEPLLADFEDEWSEQWLPRGQSIRFDRNQLLRDDLATTAQAVSVLVGAGVISADEARNYLKVGPGAGQIGPGGPLTGPAPPQPEPIGAAP